MILDKKIEFISFDINKNKFRYISLNDIKQKLKQFNGIESILKFRNIDSKENIYFILNDFISSRKEENLIGFNFIGIDLDIKEGFGESNNNKIKEKLEEIEDICDNLLGLRPFKINLTYKGFHIIFKLDKEQLYFLDKDLYKELYKKINEELGGDDKMKGITGILKLENYYDYKNGRNFLIKNIYKNDNNIIYKENIELLLNKKVKLEDRSKMLEKIEKKEKNKSKIYEMIENIDAIDFIKKINENTKYNINIEDNNIDNTSGLKIFFNKEKNKNEIKDFSEKNRHGNRLFLLNYVLKDIEDKENKLLEYIKILNIFGINFNKNYLNNTEEIDLFSILGFKKNEFFYENSVITEINNKIINNKEKGDLLKILLSYNLLSGNENKFVGIKEIIDYIGLFNNSNNRKKILEIIIKLSYLKYNKEIIDNEGNKIIKIKNLFEIEIKNNNKQKFVRIKYNININNFKKIKVNKKIFEIKKSEKFLMALYLISNKNISNVFKVKIDEIAGILGVKKYEDIKKVFLRELKKEKLIEKFEKKGNYVIYY